MTSLFYYVTMCVHAEIMAKNIDNGETYIIAQRTYENSVFSIYYLITRYGLIIF